MDKEQASTFKKHVQSLKEVFVEESMSADLQRNKVAEFKAGKSNILITTNVTEEGFDIPSCSMVISFN